MFHRAGKLGSLVNPQLNDFRRVMFNPILYTNWERLMVGTGLQNNQLFPTLLLSMLAVILTAGYNSYLSSMNSNTDYYYVGSLVVGFVPLFLALWGASLFQPGNQGAGFATTTLTSSSSTSNISSTDK